MNKLVAVLALAALLTPRPVRADVPPDPDSADAHCTLAEQCPGGTFCEYAFSPGAPESEWKHVGEACRKAAFDKGLEQRCRDGGNYGGQQLFCPPGQTGSWSPPGQKVTSTPEPTPAPTPAAPKPEAPKPEAPKSSACAVNGETGAAGLVWLCGALWLSRRRRAG